jgi:phosphonopyruvate decarboxylase
MNLGTLVTIAHAAPKNLVHCLCQNGTYETNGAVDIPGRGKVSFPGLAREAGYPKTYRFEHLDAWERAVAGILQEDGPLFVDLHVEPGEPYPEDFRRLYDIEYRERFRRALANA